MPNLHSTDDLTMDQLADLLFGSPPNASPYRNRAERKVLWERHGSAITERYALPGYRPAAFWELATARFDPVDGAQPLRLFRAGVLAGDELETVERNWQAACVRAEALADDLARRGRSDLASKEARRILRAAGVPSERWPEFAREAPLPVEYQRDPYAITTRG